jgi:phosphatidate cytidylyltransferase
MVALAELFKLMHRVHPPVVAGYLAVIALVLAARYGGRQEVLIVLMASLPLVFFVTAARRRRAHASWAMAVVFLGIVWIGLPLAHAQLLRDLPHGGALIVDTLIGTFIGDTAAYFGGRLYGRTRLAPRLSPNKTVEGLVAGIVGGTFAFWFAASYQDWLSSGDALIIGACVALAAPIGDLFESLIKRDLEVKDTGKFFGAHGGVLDRLDAVLFTVPVAYYVSLAVLA